VTHSEIDVRPATAADAPHLARLRFEFRSRQAAVEEAGAAFTARCEPWMRARLTQDAAWRAWVCVQPETGTLVGTLWLQLVEKLPNPGQEPELHAYVTSVYVRPEARNGGLGSRLIEAALTACRAMEVDTVFLWPSARSRPLYARHGFVVSDAILSQSLRP
jgi:GNAT superfamily N-acetyltransferase